MFNIIILSIGSIKAKYLKEGAEEYIKRLKPYLKLQIVELKAESFSPQQKIVAKKKEGQRIEEYLTKRPEARVFLLDEKGKEFNSLEFASEIEKTSQTIIFVIGGSLGLDRGLLDKYPKLSLSRLTFLHEMSKLLLLEQIYRAITIIKGKEYHH